MPVLHVGCHCRRLKWKTFLVSFMVDARGGAMRGCRHSGVRVIIPPRKAPMPMRITCRYLRKEKLIHPPPLMEGEACASRLLEVGPAGAKFLGPVIIEVPHFASLRGKEREIIILRSDNGEHWKEHTLEASEEAVQEVLNESFEGENDVNTLDDFSSNRITRILTTDFPQYFAVITRIRQEVHAIGPDGGMVSSTVVPQVQAIFPEGALTKKIRVGLQVGNSIEVIDDARNDKKRGLFYEIGEGIRKRFSRKPRPKPLSSETVPQKHPKCDQIKRKDRGTQTERPKKSKKKSKLKSNNELIEPKEFRFRPPNNGGCFTSLLVRATVPNMDLSRML